MNILLIDDDKLILTVVSRKLKDNGHRVLTAEDGAKALILLEKQKIDLVISDVMMPGLSGLVVMNILKQFYFNKIPLILISSIHQIKFISKSISMGAYDYLLKPINFDILNKKIGEIDLLKGS